MAEFIPTGERNLAAEILVANHEFTSDRVKRAIEQGYFTGYGEAAVSSWMGEEVRKLESLERALAKLGYEKVAE